MEKELRKAAVALLGVLALSPTLAAAQGTVAPRPAIAGASIDEHCQTVRMVKRVRRWVWVAQTRKIHGRRVVVRVHGKVSYVRVRVWRWKTVAQPACTPATPPPPAAAPPLPSVAFPPAPIAPMEPAAPSLQPPLNVLPPTISGGSREGGVLTADTGVWSGVATSFSYRWLRCDAAGGSCAPISQALSSSYALATADVAHTLRVTVTATNSAGSSAATSTPTEPVSAALRPPVNMAVPAISGSPLEAGTLEHVDGSWTNEPTNESDQWLRCSASGSSCEAIAGATSEMYVPAGGDVGHALRVQETASNAAGASAPATSAPSEPVTAAEQPPANASPPAISGVAQQGKALSASTGSWTGSPTAFAYEWLRCDSAGANCAPIGLATTASYSATEADVGSTLRVSVTAFNAAGSSVPANSAPSELVAAAEHPPANTGPPTVSGIAQQGKTLTAGAGSWTNNPTTFAYKWKRCSAAGTSCKAITGASTASLALGEEDVGSTLRVAVVASNAAGPSTPATSAPSEVVVAAEQPPANTSPPAVTGPAQQGQTLIASPGSWTNSPTAFGYEWLRCDSAGANCTPIASATAPKYTAVEADVGSTLRVVVVASNAAGPSAPATSAPSEVVTSAEQPPTAPTNTSSPAVSGVTQEGRTLSASPGSWTGSPTAFSYEWLRCDSAGANCAPIASATTSTYGVVESDVGSTLRVVVTASNAAGPSAPATSAPSEVVVAAEHPPANTSPPTVTGVAQEGHTLSASPGSWTGAPTAFGYEWLRCDSAGANCAPIASATTSKYNVGEADVGGTLRVAVTASNAAGPSAPDTSAPSEVVTAAEHPPANTSPPAIAGVAQDERTLSATTGSWTGSPTAFAYEWLRCDSAGANCAPLASAKASKYRVVEADVGSTLRVAVTASNAAGPSLPATSAQTAVVAAAPRPPTNTGPPAISGVAQEGQTLSASPGSWTGAPTAFGYEWLRCDSAGANCAPIASATTSTYGVVEADVGSTLRVAVTASNAAGPSAPAVSAPTAVVTAAEHPPANTSPPAIGGVAQEGQTLSASPGGWTGAPTSFAYLWKRCDAAGANCAAITSATGTSYSVAQADVGSTLRVEVTATNPAGPSSPAASAQTAVVGERVHRLEYVVQMGTVSVYDIDHEFELVKTISLPQTKDDVRGVTVAPSTHTMYITHGGDGPINSSGNGSVLAYDLVSEKVLWDVKLTTGVDSGQVSPDGSKLYIPTGENTSTGIWNVLSAANGELIGTIQGGTLAHNTVASSDGRYVYLGARGYNFLDVYETATGKVKEVGPMIGSVRPFTVNGSNTLAFTTATGFDGFQISSVTTGKVLYTVSFGEIPQGFPFTTASHGIALSPDEREAYVIDAVHKEVQVWDVSKVKEGVAPAQLGVIPVEGLSGNESPCVYDCGRGGWLQLTRDGRYLFVGDSGEVIDTSTLKVTTTLSTLAQTKNSIEVEWQGGLPIATSERTGVGYVQN